MGHPAFLYRPQAFERDIGRFDAGYQNGRTYCVLVWPEGKRTARRDKGDAAAVTVLGQADERPVA